MRNRSVCILIVCLLWLFSCRSEKQGNNVLDLNEGMEHARVVSLSEICDSVRYVKLETSDSSMLHVYESRSYLTGEFIFVLSENQLFRFNAMTGEYIDKINRQGRGPGEFLQIRCLAFDFAREEIYLYDNLLGKAEVVNYELQPLRTLSSLRHDIISMVFKDGELVCGLERDDYRKVGLEKTICVLSPRTGEELYFKQSRVPPIEAKQLSMFSYGTTVEIVGDWVCYHEAHSNDIYRLFPPDRSDSLIYHIDLGKPYPLEWKYMNEKQEDIFNFNRFGYFSGSRQYLFVGFSPSRCNERWIAVYEKATGKLQVADPEAKFRNDIDGGISPYSCNVQQNCLVYKILPSAILDEASEIRKSVADPNSSALAKLIDHTQPEDNPILMLCFLKK